MAAAIHTLDTILQPPNSQRSIEATVMLASLRAHPRPGVSSSDITQERAKARDLFDRVLKGIDMDDARASGHNLMRPSRNITEDKEMHIEVARLWQAESLDRTGKAVKEALRISEIAEEFDPRLLNNMGALHHLEEDFPAARSLYEKALTSVSGLGTGESMSTSILYNLARVYEDQGEEALAKDAYDKLMSRHPEYVDGMYVLSWLLTKLSIIWMAAKIREACMLSNLNRHNEAHEMLKQCLVSQNNNLNLRAFYTYFLIQSNLPKPAKDFVFATLKDHDNHDIYSLCAAGWIMYHQSRESRDTSPKGLDERRRGFQRSAEFYEKALHLDPLCAIAAQGLAIATAEDALDTFGGVIPPSGIEETQKRFKNAREALDIFAKVRESINDGCVYLNMGHCHYARDEFDRAIESVRFFLSTHKGLSFTFFSTRQLPHDFMGLITFPFFCVCVGHGMRRLPKTNHTLLWMQLYDMPRWWAWAYRGFKLTDVFCWKALHIQPNDKAIVYNIAMIQQKSAEMLFAIAPSKRSLQDLEKVIAQAAHAQKWAIRTSMCYCWLTFRRLFASLASDRSPLVPYSRDIADQRRKYGDNMLRKGDEHLTSQRQYESEAQAKLDTARRRRQEEKERQEALEVENSKLTGWSTSSYVKQQRQRESELRQEAEKLAEERRIAREQVMEWTKDAKMESDDERERKPKKARKQKHDGSGDEAEPKKKRRGKLKKTAEQEDGEDQAVFSDEDDNEKPAKKVWLRNFHLLVLELTLR
jgi:RNA polymerase-associated protein CTR9